MIYDYELIKKAETLDYKIDILTESSPVSDYENYTNLSKGMQEKTPYPSLSLKQKYKSC